MWNFPLLPEQASTTASRVDALWWGLIGVASFFTLLIFFLILIFSVRYHEKKKVDRTIRRSDYIKLEILWTVIPLVLSFGIFGWGAKVYFDMRKPPEDAMEIYVVAKQWMWKIQHPGGNSEINELHVPLGRRIKLVMTSQDVIHSFFVPAFRVKQDVLPGRYTTEWFEPTKVGEYHLFCAEYCGTMHSGMVGRVVVMEPAAYEQWLAAGTGAGGGGRAGGGAGISMRLQGERLFSSQGCISCHTSAPSVNGPSLAGLAGREVRLAGGGTLVADDEYLRESIVNSQAKIVEGYRPIMPSYRDQLTEEQISDLVEYIKSLTGSGDLTSRKAAGGPSSAPGDGASGTAAPDNPKAKRNMP